MFVSHLYVVFGEMSKSFSHFLIELFVFLVLSCMNCLYILKINPLLVVSFAIIFPHSESCHMDFYGDFERRKLAF